MDATNAECYLWQDSFDVFLPLHRVVLAKLQKTFFQSHFSVFRFKATAALFISRRSDFSRSLTWSITLQSARSSKQIKQASKCLQIPHSYWIYNFEWKTFCLLLNSYQKNIQTYKFILTTVSTINACLLSSKSLIEIVITSYSSKISISLQNSPTGQKKVYFLRKF